MRAKDRRKYEMYGRVVVFGKMNPNVFTEATRLGEVMAAIQEDFASLSSHYSSITGDDASILVTGSDKARARKELRGYLETVSRIGRSVGLRQFVMPKAETCVGLLAVGRNWSVTAEPHQELFEKSGLKNFLNRLKGLTEQMSQAVEDKDATKGSRTNSAVAIQQTLKRLAERFRQLDPMVRHVLQEDRPALAAWVQACRVDRAPVHKSPATVPSGPVTVPSEPATIPSEPAT